MKVYVMRHEQRYINPQFFTELTETGKNNAIKLAEKLNDLQINNIYSSPFIRTLQTVYPYCKKYNKKVIVTKSIYEYIGCYLEYLIHTSFCKFYDEKNINDLELLSIIKKIDTKSYDISNLPERISIILNYLKNVHCKYDNILLVTHQSVVKELVKQLSGEDLYLFDIKEGHLEGPFNL